MSSTVKNAIALFKMRQDWLGEGAQPVGRSDAQARANVCLGCPMNQEQGWREGLKGAVANLIQKQIELKNSLRLRVEGEKRLHVCEGCGCILRLKVHVPLKHVLSTTDTKALHPDCWILKESS